MNRISYSTLRRFFIVASGVAVGFALLAAAVNLVVGPVNLGMWLMPAAVAAISTLMFVLCDAVVRQADDPDLAPWMVRRVFGKRVAYYLRDAYGRHTRFCSVMFPGALPGASDARRRGDGFRMIHQRAVARRPN